MLSALIHFQSPLIFHGKPCYLGVYLVAWTPYAVFAMKVAFGVATEVHPITFAILELFMKSSVILNPMMHIVYNKKYRFVGTFVLVAFNYLNATEVIVARTKSQHLSRYS